MSKHVAISPEDAADRLAIRELIEAYAHCADRRDAKGQMGFFADLAPSALCVRCREYTRRNARPGIGRKQFHL
jgi:hypothetical protein